jgi:predicted ArsR family transcriptional regulator
MVDEEIKTRVFHYVSANPQVTEDDVAAALKIHVIDVLQALVELEKEGKVQGLEVEGDTEAPAS